VQDWVYTYTIDVPAFPDLTDQDTIVNCVADAVEPVPPTVSDFCGNEITPTGPVASDPTDCEGGITYTYTYTDCAGNVQDWVYTYTIDVPAFPDLTDQDTIVNCIADAVEPTPPSVSDFCGTAITPSGPVIDNPVTCEGDITYTYTYTDCAGNVQDWVYTYTIDVPAFPDLTDQDTIVNCIADAVTPTPPAVSDFCGNAITPTGPDIDYPVTCEGDISYTYTYTDCAGNVQDWVYTYTIDIPAFPDLTDQDTIVNCIADAVTPTPPTVSDFCGNAITPTGPDIDNPVTCEGDITYT
jgi:hypothetical protein